MENNKTPALRLNRRGYLEFTFKNVDYFILEGVLTLKGRASGFSSEYDDKVYFIDRKMPNERLKEGLKYAMVHYLDDNLNIQR